MNTQTEIIINFCKSVNILGNALSARSNKIGIEGAIQRSDTIWGRSCF